jgi:hypothetical protein
MLATGLFSFFQSLSKYNQSVLFLSIEVLPFLGAVEWDGRQGSFAAFGFCGLPVWAANVPWREGTGALTCSDLSLFLFYYALLWFNQSKSFGKLSK